MIISLICRLVIQNDLAIMRLVFVSLFAVLTLVSIVQAMQYGSVDLNGLPAPTGKFGVGVKHIYSDTTKQSLIVVYPTDRETWDARVQDERNWFEVALFGDEFFATTQAMTAIQFSEEENPSLPTLNYLFKGIFFPTVKNAELAQSSALGEPLKPIIFNHGFFQKGTDYLTMMHELASHGHIVFSMDMIDGSTQTKLADGRVVTLDKKALPGTEYMNTTTLDKRVSQVSSLIDDLEKEDFLQRKLGFPPSATLDMGSLAMNGHSFGGASSIGATVADQRIKICLTIDPYLTCAASKDYSKYNIGNRPIQILESQLFYEHDDPVIHNYARKDMPEFYRAQLNAGSKDVQVYIMQGHGHMSNSDAVYFDPVTMKFAGMHGPLPVTRAPLGKTI